METLEVLNRRKSVRSFTGEMISDEELKAILTAAQESAVGMGNYKGVHLTVVESKEIMQEFEENAAKVLGRPDMKALYGAPLFILVSAKPDGDNLTIVEHSNAATIVQNMITAAVDLGVGTCHIWGAVMSLAGNPELIKKFQLPEGYQPCCGLILGKTNETYEKRQIDNTRISTNYLR